jgi:hypothetical protein
VDLTIHRRIILARASSCACGLHPGGSRSRRRYGARSTDDEEDPSGKAETHTADAEDHLSALPRLVLHDIPDRVVLRDAAATIISEEVFESAADQPAGE